MPCVGTDAFDVSYGVTGIIVGAIAGVLAGLLFVGTPGALPVGALLPAMSVVFATGGFVLGSLLASGL